MVRFRVLCVGQASIRAVEVFDEGVAAVARRLGRWLPSSLTLFFSHVVLAIANSATFLTLKICMA